MPVPRARARRRARPTRSRLAPRAGLRGGGARPRPRRHRARRGRAASRARRGRGGAGDRRAGTRGARRLRGRRRRGRFSRRHGVRPLRATRGTRTRSPSSTRSKGGRPTSLAAVMYFDSRRVAGGRAGERTTCVLPQLPSGATPIACTGGPRDAVRRVPFLAPVGRPILQSSANLAPAARTRAASTDVPAVDPRRRRPRASTAASCPERGPP